MKECTKFYDIGAKAALLCIGLATFSPVKGQQVLLNENFTTSTGATPPAGWTNVSNNAAAAAWDFSDVCMSFNSDFDAGTTAMSGNIALMNTGCSEEDANADLTTGVFDGSLGGSYFLEFDNSILNYSVQLCEVDIWNGTVWVNVMTVYEMDDGAYSANHKNINITSACGGFNQAKVRFHYEGNFEFWWAIDNVKITRLPCTAPAASFAVVPDCPNVQYFVDVDITSMGSAGSLTLTDGTNNFSSPITAIGTYTAGPFTNATDYTLTLVHSDNALCNLSQSVGYACPPANDECNTATPLALTQTYIPVAGTTSGATVSVQAMMNNCVQTNYGDVWYIFVATGSNAVVKVKNVTATNPAPGADDYSFGIVAYGGACAALNYMGCNWHYDSLTLNMSLLTAGQTYLLRLWSDIGFDAANNTYDGARLNFEIGVTSPSAPLATRLVSIKAENAGKGNNITWQTAHEDMGDRFELERSADGKVFRYLSGINGKGIASNYTYYDFAPLPSDNYYRLKLISKTGEPVYSKTVKTTSGNDNSFSIEVYPNPVNKKMTIKSPANGNCLIVITDVSGKVVLQSEANGPEVDIDVSKMTAGIYFLKYVSNNFSKTIKVIKQ